MCNHAMNDDAFNEMSNTKSNGVSTTGCALVLQLYDDPHSLFCFKVRLALAVKGLQWHALSKRRDSDIEVFRSRVPLMKIPALVVQNKSTGDEQVLLESEVIIEYLEEQFPGQSLLPIDLFVRAKARTISRFHDLYLEPALRVLYPHMAPSVRDLAIVESGRALFVQRLKQLECLLLSDVELAVSDELSLADCGYPALFLYADIMFDALEKPIDYNGFPRVSAYRQALHRNRFVQCTLPELAEAGREWLAGKLKQI